MPEKLSRPKQIVADIGGTHTRVALTDGPALIAGSVTRYKNDGFSSFDDVLHRFLADQNVTGISGVAVAVAALIRDGVADMTNLDWRLDLTGLRKVTGCPDVVLINDLQAQGYALGHIDAEGFAEIKSGKTGTSGAVEIVVGIGTGFNAAYVVEAMGERAVFASECGHMRLAGAGQGALNVAGIRSIEHLLSGPGLERIYASQNPGQSLKAVQIMQHAEQGDTNAEAALSVCLEGCGLVLRDLALAYLPYGGISLAGGVARAFAPHMERLGTLSAFRGDDQFSPMMNDIAIRLITDDFAALTGCARHMSRVLWQK